MKASSASYVLLPFESDLRVALRQGWIKDIPKVGPSSQGEELP